MSSAELRRYQPLLSRTDEVGKGDRSPFSSVEQELETTPLVWWNVKETLERSDVNNNNSDRIQSSRGQLQQYAVLGHDSSKPGPIREPVLLNTNAPWSAFLCGSQGSGKSHTLSCMLENCLLNNDALGRNPNPLAGLVLHYDGSRGSGVCEAAYLCSSIKTTVLVSASNYGNLKKRYEDMARQHSANIEVKKLLIAPKHLDTERVKSLMAVAKDGEAPLYIQTLVKIIREIAIRSGGIGIFDYTEFKAELDAQMFSEKQNQPLKLRIDLLESFLDLQPKLRSSAASIKQKKWSPSPDYLIGASGELVIIDLTDPVVDVDSACVLFDTCLSIFVAQTTCAKVIALDEAHNYLTNDNTAAKQFTGKLLKSIREQRHQGTRIVIATQEPGLDTALLDLCSIIMVHRCSSPAWFTVLKKHVASIYLNNDGIQSGKELPNKSSEQAVFRQIVNLELGESLLFCPTAVVGLNNGKLQMMVDQFVRFRTRQRITADGGRTRLADGE